MSYPDLRPSVTGHWPLRITDIPVGQPMLGEHLIGPKGRGLLMGWVTPPANAWQPQDLLWTPPGTKALDLAGEIIDVKTWPGLEGQQWMTAQLKKRDQYLEIIRQRVLAGTTRLTAALAKLLGLPFGDGALLESRGNGASLNDPLAIDLRAERQQFLQNVGRLA